MKRHVARFLIYASELRFCALTAIKKLLMKPSEMRKMPLNFAVHFWSFRISLRLVVQTRPSFVAR